MWTRRDVALELGGVLKARSFSSMHRPPPSHRLFSDMPFVPNSGWAQQLGENDVEKPIEQEEEVYGSGAVRLPEDGTNVETKETSEAELGGWLQSDEIEDFD